MPSLLVVTAVRELLAERRFRALSVFGGSSLLLFAIGLAGGRASLSLITRGAQAGADDVYRPPLFCFGRIVVLSMGAVAKARALAPVRRYDVDRPQRRSNVSHRLPQPSLPVIRIAVAVGIAAALRMATAIASAPSGWLWVSIASSTTSGMLHCGQDGDRAADQVRIIRARMGTKARVCPLAKGVVAWVIARRCRARARSFVIAPASVNAHTVSSPTVFVSSAVVVGFGLLWIERSRS